jgi:hypothetical protein
MPETKQILFTHKEVAEALVRRLDVREGLSGLYIEFSIAAANVTSPSGTDLLPAAIVPVLRVGIQRFDEANSLTVDAASVNPTRRTRTKSNKVKKAPGVWKHRKNGLDFPVIISSPIGCERLSFLPGNESRSYDAYQSILKQRNLRTWMLVARLATAKPFSRGRPCLSIPNLIASAYHIGIDWGMDEPEARKSVELRAEAQRQGVEFIKTELKSGFTFADLARTEYSMGALDGAQRATANAMKAHNVVVKFLPQAQLGEEERQEIEGKLMELKQVIEQLQKNLEAE